MKLRKKKRIIIIRIVVRSFVLPFFLSFASLSSVDDNPRLNKRHTSARRERERERERDVHALFALVKACPEKKGEEKKKDAKHTNKKKHLFSKYPKPYIEKLRP